MIDGIRLAELLMIAAHMEQEGEEMYRVIKAGDSDFHVQTKPSQLMPWLTLHSTPGFDTEKKAIDWLNRFREPEVVYEDERK